MTYIYNLKFVYFAQEILQIVVHISSQFVFQLFVCLVFMLIMDMDKQRICYFTGVWIKTQYLFGTFGSGLLVMLVDSLNQII